jgi:hypothetical protein
VVNKSSEIIEMVKDKFDFISYNEYNFSEEYSWLEIINVVYIEPLDRVTVKRHKKADGFKGYSKVIGVIEFGASNSNRNLKNSKDVLTSVHDLKYYLRDKKFPDIPRWLIAHSTESTEETEILLDNLKEHCI